MSSHGKAEQSSGKCTDGTHTDIKCGTILGHCRSLCTVLAVGLFLTLYCPHTTREGNWGQSVRWWISHPFALSWYQNEIFMFLLYIFQHIFFLFSPISKGQFPVYCDLLSLLAWGGHGQQCVSFLKVIPAAFPTWQWGASPGRPNTLSLLLPPVEVIWNDLNMLVNGSS